MHQRNQHEEITSIVNYLIGIGYNLLGNVADAEDAVQDVYCKFLGKKPELQESKKLKSYLAKMVSNLCIDILRKKKRPKHKCISLEKIEEPSHFLKEPDVELASWLARLSPKNRLVIDLFYRENHSIQEIADILGEKGNNVKVRLHRARQSLKAMAFQEGVFYG